MGVPLDLFDEKYVTPLPPTVFAQATPPPVTKADATQKALASLAKDIVLPRFSGRNVNAEAWLSVFERECTRLAIPTTRQWEALRLMLEEDARKWYDTTVLTNPSTAWEIWKDSFLLNFTQTGLAAARSAFAYRYYSGDLNAYCQSKLLMLSSFDPKMSELSKMAHLALGLPPHMQDRIDIAEYGSVSNLVKKINSFTAEKPRPPNSSANSRSQQFSTAKSSNAFVSIQRSPCAFCKKRYGRDWFNHSETNCNNKKREAEARGSAQPAKAINSISLQDLKSEISKIQKNE
jgi:hypothetical protein